MRVLNDYKCNEGHVNEMWVDRETKEVPCPTCGKEATKIIRPLTVKFIGGGWPDKSDKWAKAHEYHGDVAKARRGEELG